MMERLCIKLAASTIVVTGIFFHATARAQSGPNTLPPGKTQEATVVQKQPAACSGLTNTAGVPDAPTVLLSWNASVPASPQMRDGVIGYIVYRSGKSHDRKALPINTNRLIDTSCIDSQVQPDRTYYYVTRAVSASGALSGPSNEVRVQIPPRGASSTK
jgi:hypothetical protein